MVGDGGKRDGLACSFTEKAHCWLSIFPGAATQKNTVPISCRIFVCADYNITKCRAKERTNADFKWIQKEERERGRERETSRERLKGRERERGREREERRGRTRRVRVSSSLFLTFSVSNKRFQKASCCSPQAGCHCFLLLHWALLLQLAFLLFLTLTLSLLLLLLKMTLHLEPPKHLVLFPSQAGWHGPSVAPLTLVTVLDICPLLRLVLWSQWLCFCCWFITPFSLPLCIRVCINHSRDRALGLAPGRVWCCCWPPLLVASNGLGAFPNWLADRANSACAPRKHTEPASATNRCTVSSSFLLLLLLVLLCCGVGVRRFLEKRDVAV